MLEERTQYTLIATLYYYSCTLLAVINCLLLLLSHV